MGFIILLILTTLAIASCAAFFSIYGLAAIFSGIFWPVVIMGSVLEAGKLVAVSYVYRYRETISWFMKIYLVAAILVLMLITSAGIFGYLSMGYQQDTLPLKQQEQQIILLIAEKDELTVFKSERLARRKQIDTDIAALPNNFIKGRQRLLKTYKPELDQLRTDIESYTKRINDKTLEISNIKQQKLISEVHTGPIIYISKVFDSDIDDATKWMIILIMFAFDPLAVALTIGINNAMVQRRRKLGIVEQDSVNDNSDREPGDDYTFTRPTSNIEVDELKAVLAEMKTKELTPAEMAQMGMIEEMLSRKMVTEKIRNPNKNS